MQSGYECAECHEFTSFEKLSGKGNLLGMLHKESCSQRGEFWPRVYFQSQEPQAINPSEEYK